MDILNSDWLMHMLAKAGKTPQARLLGLFDVLDDWIDAPGISSQIKFDNLDVNHSALHTYLSLEAAKAGATLPDMLATQLCLMAISACCEKLQKKTSQTNRSLPTTPLLHAKQAAKALIAAQTKKEFHIKKSSAYAIAASFVGALVVAGTLLSLQPNSTIHSNKAAIASNAVDTKPTLVASGSFASPEDTAALFAQIEQMRKGSCQLIEAIQLPDSYKKVYFENIVLGRISTDPNDQKLVKELLQKVRCNYTPMLMANSTG